MGPAASVKVSATARAVRTTDEPDFMVGLKFQFIDNFSLFCLKICGQSSVLGPIHTCDMVAIAITVRFKNGLCTHF